MAHADRDERGAPARDACVRCASPKPRPGPSAIRASAAPFWHQDSHCADHALARDAGAAVIYAFSQLGWLPDATIKMALLMQCCTPSAQNLVTLSALDKSTAALATPLAQLLLRQYVLAVVPMTAWVLIFMSSLDVPGV